jgi:hypothetical protein
MEAELGHLTQEHADLKELAQKHKLPAKQFDLREGEQRLAELREREKKLAEFVQRIEEAIKQGEQNVGLSQMLEKARLLEVEAEFGQAIALYDKVLKASPDQPKVRARLEELRQGWALKGDKEKHRQARAFVYETWPTLDVAGLKKSMDEARAALATLKSVDDRLTPQKLIQVDAVHAANLKKELARLRQKDTEDSRNQAKAIAEVAVALGQLHAAAAALVAPKK